MEIWVNAFGGKTRLPNDTLGEWFEEYVEYANTLTFYSDYDNSTTTNIKSVFTPNKKYLIELVIFSGNVEGSIARASIRQIDVQTKEVVNSIKLPESSGSNLIGQIFYADDTHIVCSDQNYTVRIYNFSGNNIIEEASFTYSSLAISKIIRKTTTDNFLLFATRDTGIIIAHKYDKSTKSIVNDTTISGSTSQKQDAGFAFDSSGNLIILSAYYSSSLQYTRIYKYNGETVALVSNQSSNYARNPDRMCVFDDIVCFSSSASAQFIFYNLNRSTTITKTASTTNVDFIFDEHAVYDNDGNTIKESALCTKYSLSGNNIAQETTTSQSYTILNKNILEKDFTGCFVNGDTAVFGINRIDIVHKISIGGVSY